MRIFCIILTVATAAAAAPPADIASGYVPGPLWHDDVLIWDMTENSTWAGAGLTYCAGIFGPEGNQYATTIIDSTGSQGDVIKIFDSSDGGNIWNFENWVTSGSIETSDPEICLSGEVPAQYLFIFVTATTSSGAYPIAFRYTIPDFQFSAFCQPDFPSDTLLSVEVVSHPENGELWVFSNDSQHDIWLSRSTNNGDSWSTAEFVADDAIVPAAAAGPEGWVYLAYRRASDNRIMSLAYGETSYFETEVADGCSSSAPVVASEQAGSERVAMVYHCADSKVYMVLSSDNGAHWGSPIYLDDGIYPFIDVFRQTTNTSLAYIDVPSGNIYYASANSFDQLPTSFTYQISGQAVFQQGPPVVRHGDDVQEVGLFYMSPGAGGGPAPQDLWYDNSMLTPIDPQGGPGSLGGPVLTAAPNPSMEAFGLQFSAQGPVDCTLDIYDVTGRLVKPVYSGVSSGEQLTVGSDLPAGVYTAVLRAGDVRVTRRLVKLSP